jgi:putative acetyltransferase
MEIWKTSKKDLGDILSIQRSAFQSNEEAVLVKDLLGDPSAEPVVSLLAFDGGRAVGHVLFTQARLEPGTSLSVSILAPLAVVPDFQNRGIGGELIDHGLGILKKAGGDLVFVLGHPQYYQRYGFKPAGKLGFEAPYPIPEKNADAWMVRSLRSGVFGVFSGKVICADKLNKAKYWRK